ncbi:sulfated surface glycoprotein 185-like isoform X2 [Corvus kubaryi]|uniref:sulfated surface glycoprotein 185-like isoform X2 n=1 Tax=Corvus kubaryi TaxID=68294 RepID=UPI001C04C71C|nr:sulfated surface glycoprotein 185-like isoform X2 [Corvus kubaryi]
MSQSLTLKQSTPETFGTQWESNYLMPYHAGTREPQNSSWLVQREWKYSPRAGRPPPPPPRSSAPPPRPSPPRSAVPESRSQSPAAPPPPRPPPRRSAVPSPPPPGSPGTVQSYTDTVQLYPAAAQPYPSAQRSLASEAASRGGTGGNYAAPVARETESRSARADALNLTQGFACLSTGEGIKWIPAKNMKPYIVQ